MDPVHAACLTAVSRVCDFHPRRPTVPMEVIALCLHMSHTPAQVRAAVLALRSLHSDHMSNDFLRAMNALSPCRTSRLCAARLSPDAFPLIMIELWAEDFEEAEAFFATDDAQASQPATRLGICLKVTFRDDGKQYDALSRTTRILSRFQGKQSWCELKMVTIGFSTSKMCDRQLEMARRMLALALLEIQPTPEFTITIQIYPADVSQSLTAWGRLLQTMCRVGATPTEAGDNELNVRLRATMNQRWFAAFWSAIAFSCGYDRLQVTRNGWDDIKCVQHAKYVAFACLSPVSDTVHLDSSLPLHIESHLGTTLEIQAESSLRAAVPNTLWNRAWSTQSAGAIERVFGWVLDNSGLIEVFVPCFGQRSVIHSESDRVCAVAETFPPRSWLASSPPRLTCAMQVHRAPPRIQAAWLIRAVGASLQFITLKESNGSFTLDFVATMMETCPHLRELTVDKVLHPREMIRHDQSRFQSSNLIKLKLVFANELGSFSWPGHFTQQFFETAIPIVGQSIERLEIVNTSGVIPFSRAFDVIARSCFRLLHVNLERLDVGSLDPLIESYNAGTSQVSSLYLLASPFASVSLARLAEALADRSDRHSSKLRVLHITDFALAGASARFCGLDETSITAMLAMLERNRTLNDLYIGMTHRRTWGQNVFQPLQSYKAQFDLYHDQRLPSDTESTVTLVDVLKRKNFPFTEDTIRVIAASAGARRSVRFEVVD